MHCLTTAVLSVFLCPQAQLFCAKNLSLFRSILFSLWLSPVTLSFMCSASMCLIHAIVCVKLVCFMENGMLSRLVVVTAVHTQTARIIAAETGMVKHVCRQRPCCVCTCTHRDWQSLWRPALRPFACVCCVAFHTKRQQCLACDTNTYFKCLTQCFRLWPLSRALFGVKFAKPGPENLKTIERTHPTNRKSRRN